MRLLALQRRPGIQPPRHHTTTVQRVPFAGKIPHSIQRGPFGAGRLEKNREEPHDMSTLLPLPVGKEDSMSDNNVGPPSPEILHMEREKVKAEIAQGRELIAKSRLGIAEAQRHFADSFDRLAESQKPIRHESSPHNQYDLRNLRLPDLPAGMTVMEPQRVCRCTAATVGAFLALAPAGGHHSAALPAARSTIIFCEMVRGVRACGSYLCPILIQMRPTVRGALSLRLALIGNAGVDRTVVVGRLHHPARFDIRVCWHDAVRCHAARTGLGRVSGVHQEEAVAFNRNRHRVGKPPGRKSVFVLVV